MRQADPAVDHEPQIRQDSNLDGPPTENKTSGFCSLPDAILHTILGFLPVEEAVRTSILSKRWERLWMSMPVLDFKRNVGDSQSRFINFVDRVCAFHEPFPIQMFRLDCRVLYAGPLINAWITSAIKKGQVQVLQLWLSHFTKENPPHKVVPPCVFSSETLVELRLCMDYFTLQLPALADAAASFFALPKLKRLYLMGFVFMGGGTVEKLLSSSPVLETLSFVACYFEEQNNNDDVQVKRISLSSPSLREFEIRGPLILNKTHPPISLHCPSLKTFRYLGTLENEVRICGPTTELRAAEIRLVGPPSPANALKLLKSIAHVEVLVLDCESVECFKFAQFPEFSNLIRLYMSAVHSYDRMTLPLLRRCPRLESLTIWGEVGDEPSHELLMLDGDSVVPECFRTHLKKIRLPNFSASAGDIECVGVLLQMCSVLETMVIEIAGSMSSQPPDAQQVFEKVSILPRKSESCTISVFVQPM